MDEVFDWLSTNLDSIEQTLNDVVDIDFLELLSDIESDGQNRESFNKFIIHKIKMIKFGISGFDLNLLDRLLNHVPLYEEGKVKESFSNELKEYIYTRDNSECQLCHNSWKGLYCHHINPQGKAEEDNLITLCVNCHEIIHRLLKNKGYPYYIPQRRYW